MLIKHCKHSRLNAAAGPPGETHNRRRRSCTGVDCVPSVCKSHNGKKAKNMRLFYIFLLSGTLVPHRCRLETSINGKCSIIKCSITPPQGTRTRTHTRRLPLNGSIWQIADAVLSTTSEAHSMFTPSRGDSEDTPEASFLLFNRKRLALDQLLWLGLS